MSCQRFRYVGGIPLLNDSKSQYANWNERDIKVAYENMILNNMKIINVEKTEVMIMDDNFP